MSTPAERLDSELMQHVADKIRTIANSTRFDYRPLLPVSIRERFPHIGEDYHAAYGRYKYAVAAVLQPKTIYEVGIGWGAAARAMLGAVPGTPYFGVDSMEMGVHPAEVLPIAAGYHITDSDALDLFVHPSGPIDLIHIDGCHETEHKARDVEKAVRSGVQWMLCDDVADPMVAHGVFLGLHRCWKRQIPMAYFENSHTGSLLVHVGGAQDA